MTAVAGDLLLPVYTLLYIIRYTGGVSQYHVEVERTATKALKEIHRPDRVRLTKAIIELGTEPRPHGCLKMSGMDSLYRIKIGNYRIVYAIDDTIRVVNVTRVGHRREIYR